MRLTHHASTLEQLATSRERNREVIANSKYRENLRRRHPERRMLSAQSDRVSMEQDIGNVAVIENDGTLLVEPNPFDLQGRRIVFSPDPAVVTRYFVAQEYAEFTVGNGTNLSLSDDDFHIFFPV